MSYLNPYIHNVNPYPTYIATHQSQYITLLSFFSISLKIEPMLTITKHTKSSLSKHIYMYVKSITLSKPFPLLDHLDNHKRNSQSPTLTHNVIYALYYN